MISTVTDSGVPKDLCRIDLSIARGLAYYTGSVFETTLLDLLDPRT